VKILVITSCTGEKSVESVDQPTLDDFKRGPIHVTKLEAAMKDLMLPAEALYTGLQHARLMRGINAVRKLPGFEVDLKVLSAGYGLVNADRKLAPYEATFAGMKKSELQAWARQLNVSRDVACVLGESYDLALVLLGEDYLAACELASDLQLGGPAIFFCSAATAKKLPKVPGLASVIVTNAEAKRFGCGLVGLKGEVSARILERLGSDAKSLASLVKAGADVLGLADASSAAEIVKSKRTASMANPAVDNVIQLSNAWRGKAHRARLTYFIPEWDDLVDPDFDFETDTHSFGSGDWSNEVYAHQMYPEPNYDGILISKVVAEKSKKKAERINALGVHRFLRVPRDFPIMGDCGAFSYINDHVPPYQTSEILDYYTRLDFDYGVSIDHFAIGEGAERQRRYDLTIANAADFIREHKKRGLNWTPIGALQGWDEESFAEAAKKYVAMGYDYIAVGSMVRRRSPEIISIVKAVRAVIPSEVRLHLFGVARLNAVDDLANAGVTSADSASALRRAWMGTGQNFLGVDGKQYAAFRIPEAGKSFRAKRMVSEGRATIAEVERLEKAAIDAMRAYDRDEVSVDHVLGILHDFDQLITPDRPDNRRVLREALENKPWKACGCAICKKDGIDVMIFRGNNRNRRRGFHNTYTFYQLMQRALAGEKLKLGTDDEEINQRSLFETSEEV
jgi:hypothetical protein